MYHDLHSPGKVCFVTPQAEWKYARAIFSSASAQLFLNLSNTIRYDALGQHNYSGVRLKVPEFSLIFVCPFCCDSWQTKLSMLNWGLLYCHCLKVLLFMAGLLFSIFMFFPALILELGRGHTSNIQKFGMVQRSLLLLLFNVCNYHCSAMLQPPNEKLNLSGEEIKLS